MRVDILTIFPDFFESPLKYGIIKIAVDKKKLKIKVHDLRSYTNDRVVDDYPYGGGAGMVLKASPFFKAIRQLKKKNTKFILLTPVGKRLNQKMLTDLSKSAHLILICGRYKGVDYRVSKSLKPLMISIGDYVISGGEIGAMIVVEGVARLLPGVLGDRKSADTDSFVNGLLDSPYYTRPRVVGGRVVPKTLLSGNHKDIANWRLKESLKLTLNERPDLVKNRTFNKNELKLLLEVLDEIS